MSKYRDSGLGSNAKITKYRLRQEEGTEQLFVLSSRNIGALIESTEPLSWRNRHIVMPDDLETKDSFEAWIDDLRLKLMTPIDFCVEIASCVDTLNQIIANALADDPATQAALKEQIIYNIMNDKDVQDALRQVSGAGTIIQIEEPFGSSCDKPVIYGGATQVISDLEANALDLLEILEVATNPTERLATFVNAIPLVSASFADETLNAFDSVLSSFTENFVAISTIDFKKTLSCEMMCNIYNFRDCQPTFEDIFDFFNEKLGGSLTAQSLFTQAVQFLLTGVWTGGQIWYAMILLELTTYRWSSEWLGLDISGIKYSYKIGTENPLSSWDEDCDQCDDIPDPVPNFVMRDYFANHGLVWYGGQTNTPQFVSNPSEGRDCWDFRLFKTQDNNLQVCVEDVVQNFNVISWGWVTDEIAIEDRVPTTSSAAIYDPNPMTGATNKNFIGAYLASSNDADQRYLRVIIGPVV